ncbi:MAG TPA: DarT ssDNA thymidine ADP-ribosyltransferase family protein [Gammaproteobacteria bacterium]|nr:DarT ssDNA thymidine ADP-ribosyltransferase family protein [Gammaproteobacteria bacterium]
MESKYEIKLNFLAIRGALPSFAVYRIPRNAADPKPRADVYGFTLPISPAGEDRHQYWVRFDPAPGFEAFSVSASDNNFLTRRALFNGLCQAVRSSLQEAEFEIPRAAEYYNELARLDQVDWPLLRSRNFRRDPDDPDKFARYEAEALVHQHLPLDGLLGLVCYNMPTKTLIDGQVAERNLSLDVKALPGWYF